MMEHLNTLVAEGRWTEMRQQADTLLDAVAASDRARAHLLISTAYHNTATSAADWYASLTYAEEGLRLAQPGTPDHAWGLGKMACLLVDMGRSKRATRYALAYMSLKEKLPRLTPYVLRAMGDVAYAARQYDDAASRYSKALAAFRSLGDAEQVKRSRLNLAWSYARAGRMTAAANALPESVPTSLEHFRLSAKAIIAHAQGDWESVVAYGEAALRCPRPSYDLVDAAEACLLVAEAHQRLGDTVRAFTFLSDAARFASRQAQDASALMVLKLRAKGGDSPEKPASYGSGGFHPDACFTTGCA